MREELNLYKGKCASLQRDLELSQAYLSKVQGSDALSTNEQFNYLKERVRALELDLETAIRAKTDSAYEAKRLQQNLNDLEKQLHEAKL